MSISREIEALKRIKEFEMRFFFWEQGGRFGDHLNIDSEENVIRVAIDPDFWDEEVDSSDTATFDGLQVELYATPVNKSTYAYIHSLMRWFLFNRGHENSIHEYPQSVLRHAVQLGTFSDVCGLIHIHLPRHGTWEIKFDPQWPTTFRQLDASDEIQIAPSHHLMKGIK